MTHLVQTGFLLYCVSGVHQAALGQLCYGRALSVWFDCVPLTLQKPPKHEHTTEMTASGHYPRPSHWVVGTPVESCEQSTRSGIQSMENTCTLSTTESQTKPFTGVPATTVRTVTVSILDDRLSGRCFRNARGVNHAHTDYTKKRKLKTRLVKPNRIRHFRWIGCTHR